MGEWMEGWMDNLGPALGADGLVRKRKVSHHRWACTKPNTDTPKSRCSTYQTDQTSSVLWFMRKGSFSIALGKKKKSLVGRCGISVRTLRDRCEGSTGKRAKSRTLLWVTNKKKEKGDE